MNLYEMNAEMQMLIDAFEYAEDTAELEEAVKQLQMERAEKIENIALWIKNLNAEAVAIKAEEKALAERRKANENKSASLKNYLATVLDGQKFSTSKVALSFRKSESVIIEEESLLPRGFYTETVTFKVDKAEIKKAIKAGEQVYGAHIETKQNLQVK